MYLYSNTVVDEEKSTLLSIHCWHTIRVAAEVGRCVFKICLCLQVGFLENVIINKFYHKLELIMIQFAIALLCKQMYIHIIFLTFHHPSNQCAMHSLGATPAQLMDGQITKSPSRERDIPCHPICKSNPFAFCNCLKSFDVSPAHFFPPIYI